MSNDKIYWKVPAYKVFNAFSMALDIAEGAKTSHSKRVAYTAIRLARFLELDEDMVNNAYTAAILHDIGVGKSRLKSYYDMNLKIYHCANGEEITKNLPVHSAVTEAIRYHHENWDGSGPFKLKGREIPILAEIVHLADQVALFLNSTTTYYESRKRINELAKSKRGTEYSEELIDAFLQLIREERFWLDYGFENFDAVISRVLPKNMMYLNLNELEKIAEVFSQIIDNNSEFTINHSRGIAENVKKTLLFLRCNTIVVRKGYIAALLHDLGKLAVPNSILDKNGPLNTEERYIINTHSYYTKLILEQIPGIEDIASWAANHHEKLDGQGYPERLKSDKLDDMDRIIAVCDIYQALTENRPYRDGMSEEAAWLIIDDMVNKGQLCKIAVKNVKNALNRCKYKEIAIDIEEENQYNEINMWKIV